MIKQQFYVIKYGNSKYCNQEYHSCWNKKWKQNFELIVPLENRRNIFKPEKERISIRIRY